VPIAVSMHSPHPTKSMPSPPPSRGLELELDVHKALTNHGRQSLWALPLSISLVAGVCQAPKTSSFSRSPRPASFRTLSFPIIHLLRSFAATPSKTDGALRLEVSYFFSRFLPFSTFAPQLYPHLISCFGIQQS